MKKYITLVCSALIIIIGWACEPSAVFEQPQPMSAEDEYAFKSKFRGEYINTTDSTSLVIRDRFIIKEPSIAFKIPVTEIENSGLYELSGDSALAFMDEEEKEWLPVFLRQDTVYGVQKYIDTVFHISEENVLRSYKGRYILNYKLSENRWDITMLEKQRKNLVITKIEFPQKLEELEEMVDIEKVTDEKGEVQRVLLKPTKKQLKALLKGDKFKEKEFFRQVD
ncbi:MAG: hypothetical protein AAFX87_20715 [Bacteroidota bacterium]